jgi:polar amino acid transport system permease protein
MNMQMRTFILGMIGVPALLTLVFLTVYGEQAGAIIARIMPRVPMLLTGSADFSSLDGGFVANIVISLWSMAIAILAGAVLGTGLISRSGFVRLPCSLVMNLLRNSPWLVVLFAMLYLLPFEIEIFGLTISLSPAVKAVIGLALPVTANIAEIFRGGVQAIPSGQWESASSLGYRRLQILRHIVIPQALPLMVPNLMTMYSMLFIGTSLVVVTGANDVLSVARTIIAVDGDAVATAIYIFVLLLFFLFCFPIAILTRRLEHRVGTGNS